MALRTISSARSAVALLLIPGLLSGTQASAQARKTASPPAVVKPTPTTLIDMSDPRINQGPKAVATGDKVMVSTQLQSSTDAALKVLKDGGNAVDAALTALFVQEVADYHMVFLFGSMSALYYDAKTGKTHALVAIGQHPDPDRNGGRGTEQVVIGGTVRGAAALSKRFGSKPWASIVEPAIKEAEDGPLVTSYMYGFNFGLWETGLLGDLRGNAAARAFYMPDGHLVGAGQHWKMPAFAATLREVAKDPDYMYTGAWGQKFVTAVKKAGMSVTAEDMAEY
ncbi:MAG: gamma-glutamyltransferase, partial [Vicinamibacteria bacterium]